KTGGDAREEASRRLVTQRRGESIVPAFWLRAHFPTADELHPRNASQGGCKWSPTNWNISRNEHRRERFARLPNRPQISYTESSRSTRCWLGAGGFSPAGDSVYA